MVLWILLGWSFVLLSRRVGCALWRVIRRGLGQSEKGGVEAKEKLRGVERGLQGTRVKVKRLRKKSKSSEKSLFS